MAATYKKLVALVFGILVLLSLGVLGTIRLREVLDSSRRTADHSAHAALTVEICEQLGSIPGGKPYPTSLSQLQLTYPDGGDTSFLKRFTYQSQITNCTLQTTLRGKQIFKMFP